MLSFSRGTFRVCLSAVCFVFTLYLCMEYGQYGDKQSTHCDLPPCPTVSTHLQGRIKVIHDERNWTDIEEDLTEVKPGGEFSPTSCNPEDNVAIIIPFRNREHHLRIFINNIHPFLMRQNIHYRIFVISQNDTETFNRALLFNIGFSEALNISDWDCFIFHDVDLLPEDDRNLYTCPGMPRHNVCGCR